MILEHQKNSHHVGRRERKMVGSVDLQDDSDHDARWKVVPRSRAMVIYGLMLVMQLMLAIDLTSMAVALPASTDINPLE